MVTGGVRRRYGLSVTKSVTRLPTPSMFIGEVGVRGRWPVCVDGYRVEGPGQPSELERRWLVPASEQHRWIYLDEERSLVPAVRRLARVLGPRVTKGADDEVVSFAGVYGVPAEPEQVRGRYRVSLATIREELSTFQSFERRWDKVVRESSNSRRADTAAKDTAPTRNDLAVDMSRYLNESRVRVMFESNVDHAGLTPRLFAGPPVTAAVLRVAMQWGSGGSEVRLGPKQCESPGCMEWFAPQRKDAKFHSEACRQRACRARKVGS